MPKDRDPRKRVIAVCVSFILLGGCATTVPYTGVGPNPQLERGQPIPPVDILGNIFSLPMKLILWSWKFNLHYISPQTEEKLVEYLKARQNLPAVRDAQFQLNEYSPGEDLSRLVHNHYVAWPYRILFGFPVTLITDVLLPGRLFPWGDYFNPYTNTVHIFSDHPAIALHEAGHVFDFASRRYKGTYAAIRLIPFVDLYQEYKASKEAIAYLQETDDRPTEIAAYKIFYPAYGTYAGGYIFPPIGTIVGALLGHVTGRSEALLKQWQDKRSQIKVSEPAMSKQTISEETSETSPHVYPDSNATPAEDILKIADFDRGGWRTNFDDPFGSWDHDPKDTTQFCHARLVDEVRVGESGYSLMIDYDVDSPNPAYCGSWMKLPGVALRNFKVLSFDIKGDPDRGFTSRIKLELKDKAHSAAYVLDGIQGMWLHMRIPLHAFAGVEKIKEATEFVIVFDDETATQKIGTVYLDEVAFESAL